MFQTNPLASVKLVILIAVGHFRSTSMKHRAEASLSDRWRSALHRVGARAQHNIPGEV